MRVESSEMAPLCWQMPGVRTVQNLQMPHPRTDKAGKCLAALARRGGWAQVELTDAKRKIKNHT